jgi:hypothetical protein
LIPSSITSNCNNCILTCRNFISVFLPAGGVSSLAFFTGAIENKEIQKALELYKSLNIEAIIKDFTFENKIPVIGVLFINHNLDNDKIDESKLEDVLKLIKNYLKNENQEKDENILTKLKSIRIKGPKDFSVNLDQYLSGEKVIE